MVSKALGLGAESKKVFKTYIETDIPATIPIGFIPKYVILAFMWSNNTYLITAVYDASISTTGYKQYYSNQMRYMDITFPDLIVSITDTITFGTDVPVNIKKLTVLAVE